MRTVDIDVARIQLSRLVDAAAAGEEIIIAKAGKPMDRLGPWPARAQGAALVIGRQIAHSREFLTPRCRRRSSRPLKAADAAEPDQPAREPPLPRTSFLLDLRSCGP
jgi:antitoxin (DNA-binding transcriptional repressor) of toxin-antitoxin stability system